MAILNIQITNASLLDIEGGVGTGVDNGAWISTSYLIGEIVVIPLTDYLSRVFSFRRYMTPNTSDSPEAIRNRNIAVVKPLMNWLNRDAASITSLEVQSH